MQVQAALVTRPSDAFGFLTSGALPRQGGSSLAGLADQGSDGIAVEPSVGSPTWRSATDVHADR